MADGGVAAERLTSFIERLERLEDERRDVGDQIKDVFAEAIGPLARSPGGMSAEPTGARASTCRPCARC